MTQHDVGGNNVKVMILAGGLSHERDVSMRSGRRVGEALEERGIKADGARRRHHLDPEFACP